MGFGSLLEMKIDKNSGASGYFIVNNFDASELVMELSSGPPININRQAVHDMLGILMGDTDLLSLPLKEIIEDEEPLLTRWKSQFVVNKIHPSHLSSVILMLFSTLMTPGFFFKLNFLMLFVSTMIVGDTAGACTPTSRAAIVNRISEDTENQKIDWCGLLIHYLKNCKSNWPLKENGEYHFTGPMTFLPLLYLDSTRLEKFPTAR